MIGQSLWKNLKVLVDVDTKIDTILERVESKKNLIEKNRILINDIKNKIELLKENCLRKRKELDFEELEARNLKEKEQVKKKALESIKNQKEYSLIKKEIQRISQKRIAQEDILIKIWHEYDSIKTNLDKEQNALFAQVESINSKIQDEENSINELEKQIGVIKNEKSGVEKKVPSDWLCKYNKMKSQVKNPIVPVVGSSCGSCYYSIIRQDLQKLKNNSVLLCRNCYRFLYYETEEQEDSKSKDNGIKKD